jgi:hypothetical protein
MKILPCAHVLVLPVAVLVGACATVVRFQSVPPSADAAEVQVHLYEKSSRKAMLGGVFEDGVQCRNFQLIGAEATTDPAFRMRVAPKTLTLTIRSSGDRRGDLFGPGGMSYKSCGGTYSFEPKPGGRYRFEFHDEPETCGVRLVETLNGLVRDKSAQVVRRDAIERAPGVSRCADAYVPGAGA